ncbi:MAG: dipeptidase [Pseudohongiellaceae bacterium]
MLCIGVLLLGAVCQPGNARAASEAEVDEQARRIHSSVMVMDTHVDIPFDFASDSDDPAQRPDAQVDLARMESGGLDAAFFIVYVGQAERTEAGYRQAVSDAATKFDAIHRMTSELYGDRIGLAETAAEAREIFADGRLVAMIGVENGFVIGRDLALLQEYRDRGARYLTLVHNGHNDIGDSAQPSERLGDTEQEHGGLSPFGEQVVDELNRLGMLVDISHVSRQTMMDATRRSSAPVIASHSAVTALADHPRNMNDEQLRMLRDNGGVVQIVAFDSYIKRVPAEKTDALATLRREFGVGNGGINGLTPERQVEYETLAAAIETRWPSSTVADFVDHIEYAVDLMGIDHVGISSDFGGGGGVTGWDHAGETLNVTRELVRRGYNEEEIGKIWNGNVLRVLEQAERIAAER